jgi:hypothetical protein
MRRALAPPAAVGALAKATISRGIARALCRGDRLAHAVADFVLITVVRNRPQQTPIAMNAAIGIAVVALSVARSRALSSTSLLAAPSMLAFWAVIGLRAAFFVPSELRARGRSSSTRRSASRRAHAASARQSLASSRR